MSEQSPFTLSSYASLDNKNKKTQPDNLKDLYYAVEKQDIPSIKEILNDNDFAEKSLTKVLVKVFFSYTPENENCKLVIEELLR